MAPAPDRDLEPEPLPEALRVHDVVDRRAWAMTAGRRSIIALKIVRASS